MRAAWANDEDREWWNAWRRSPMSEKWGEVDWAYLQDCAHLRHQYYEDPSPSWMAELRLRLTKMGATAEDRLKLRMAVQGEAAQQKVRPRAIQPDSEEAAKPVADMEERRRRLLGG